mmetsp:Transcript_73160/g.190932  ORF Transcript_73160/g.190932 Transcript_73160/m.190932 type:complete len:359 (+) Transcript_73160:562-1638(+)
MRSAASFVILSKPGGSTFSFASEVAASTRSRRLGAGLRPANSARALALMERCDHSSSSSRTMCLHGSAAISGHACLIAGAVSAQWWSLQLASVFSTESARGATTRRNAAFSLSSMASSSLLGALPPWLFLHSTEHLSASLSTASRLEGSSTSSMPNSIFRLPSHLFSTTALPPPRLQKRTRSECSPLSLSSSLANSFLLMPASSDLPGATASPSSASLSLSSISTRTGPAGAGAASAGSAGGSSGRAARASSASLAASSVFSRRSRASLSFGKSFRASSRSASASVHLCRARRATARLVKALKQASALRVKPSSKISEYSMTLLQEATASCQRNTLSSASALLVHRALQSLLYSSPSS